MLNRKHEYQFTHVTGAVFPKGWLDSFNPAQVRQATMKEFEAEEQRRNGEARVRSRAVQEAYLDFTSIDRAAVRENPKLLQAHWNTKQLLDVQVVPHIPLSGFETYEVIWARLERKADKAAHTTALREAARLAEEQKAFEEYQPIAEAALEAAELATQRAGVTVELPATAGEQAA